MKKFFTTVLFLMAVSLCSCSSAKSDKFGWYSNYESAKKIAQKNKQNIILFVSSFEDDERSASLDKDVLRTDDFKKFAKDNSLVCINLNFSQAEFQSSMVADDASSKEKKAAQKIKETYEENMRIVTGYYIEDTPAIFLTTADGYLISTLTCDDSVVASKDLIALIEAEAENAQNFNNLVAATNTGSNIEKANAIDALYEATNPQSRFLLADKISAFLTLDKSNETGLVGKYLFASANVDAQNAYFEGDIEKAVTAFDQVVNSEFTSPDEKQQAHYMAGYTLIQTGSNDINRIIDTYQKSYDASPDSEYAQQIMQTILMLQTMRDAQNTAPEAEAPAQN